MEFALTIKEIEAEKYLKEAYIDCLKGIKYEIDKIIDEQTKSLKCLKELNIYNQNVLRYIFQENVDVEASLKIFKNKWSTYFGFNEDLIYDLEKNMELLNKLNVERENHNKNIGFIKNKLIVYRRYLESSAQKIYKESYTMDYLSYINTQIDAVKEKVYNIEGI